ncbi:MAG: NUDIX domain-containing protein [Gammaproteobacteria bacterium]
MQWKIKQRERNYDGHFKVDQLTIEHELFSGATSKPLIREQVSRHNAVAVLPFDPERDEVVLVEQFRVGALNKDDLQQVDTPWLIEVIAGLVEEGEELENVACREALEEADCKIENIMHVASFFPSPGGFSEQAHVYLAKTNTAELGGIYGLEEEGEDIRVHVVPSEQAIEMLHKGKICSAISMVAMYNFMRLREKLKQDWSGG